LLLAPSVFAALATFVGASDCLQPYDQSTMKMVYGYQPNQIPAGKALCNVIKYELTEGGRVVAVKFRDKGSAGGYAPVAPAHRDIYVLDSPTGQPVALAPTIEITGDLSQNIQLAVSPNGKYAAFFGLQSGQPQQQLFVADLDTRAVRAVGIKSYYVTNGLHPRGEFSYVASVNDAGEPLAQRLYTAAGLIDTRDIVRVAANGVRTVLVSGRFMLDAVGKDGSFLVVPSDGGFVMPPVKKKIVHVSAAGAATTVFDDQHPEAGARTETYELGNSAISGDGKVVYSVIKKDNATARLIRFDIANGAVTRRTIFGDPAACAAAVPVCN
jgi:hypothetical protein